ncbi:MAG: UDP-N-acetylglucosamine 2-epimerase (non-hydrolyzing) [Armatimonadota bacterium]
MGTAPCVLVVCGTRPDAIKLAPVVLQLKEQPSVETVVVGTGQHREMLDQVLSVFSISLDENYGVMQKRSDLARLTSAILERLDDTLERRKPAVVVAQGDTTTTFVASLAAFYRRVPFAHVEAGLRTPTIDRPFPEEFNRRATSLLTTLYFAPTQRAANNLRREGVNERNILITGNTSIDALRIALQRAPKPPHRKGRMLLVTTHRRENWGEPQRRIATAIRTLLQRFPDTYAVLPMHPNPIVRQVLQTELEGGRASREPKRVELIEPPDYLGFAALMAQAHLILTDSGGVQEEAPSLGKPVLVLREETERPEGVDAGAAILVGTEEERIVHEASRLLQNDAAYHAVAQVRNPYGDGHAAERIVAALIERFAPPSPSGRGLG